MDHRKKILLEKQGRLIAILSLAGLLIAIAPEALPKGISSPDQLGPYHFLSYIDSRNGSITEFNEQNSEGSEVLYRDPVIDGRLVEGGILAVGNTMTAEGPLAWLNYDLLYISDDFIGSSFMTIGSEVSYDFAILGSVTGTVDVRIMGSSFGDTSGRNVSGMPIIARANRRANVFIYDTDESGNADNVLWSGNLNTVVSLETNTLYKVVLYTEATITLSSIAAFQLSGYSFLGPISLQSENENAEVYISEFGGSVPPSQPMLNTLRTDGEDSNAKFSGGVRLANGDTFDETFEVGDSVHILSSISPEPYDVGRDAEVFVVVSTGSEFIQITSMGLRSFNGSLSDLLPFTQIPLSGVNEMDLLSQFGGQIMLDANLIGNYEFFIGYTVDGVNITYGASPIRLNTR